MSRDKAWSFGVVTKHSTILIFAGLSLIAMGISFHYYLPHGPRWDALVVARNVMNLDAWGNLFIICGILVTIMSHWPNWARTWGYTVLTGLSIGWGTFLIVGMGFGHHPGSSLSSALVWIFQGVVWWLISGLPDVALKGKGRLPIWTGWRKKK